MSLVAAGDILESSTLVGLDVPPVIVPTAGEGSGIRLVENEDFILPTSSNVQFSTYTLGPRIPTNAKIKKVQMYGKGIDSNATAAFAVDVNLIFSDAPLGGIAAGQPVNDGTIASNAGQIPTSALTGNVTTITSYTSPNKMFGSSVVAVANSGAFKLQELTHANTFTFAMRQQPLWEALGYTQDPGGFFNFFVVCETASSTAAAGTLGLIVDYAL